MSTATPGWLSRCSNDRLGFTQQDNAFTALDDPQAAQKLADSFVDQNWRKILNRLVRQVNPLMRQPWFRSLSYYWVVDQAEFSTDLIFTSREALAGLYPRLLDHAAVNFSAKDILTFLGRRFHPRFDGEVLTHCQKGRWPGARIKHRMKNNWLKMYDKFALVLRIETVINNPREFRVRRLRTRDGRREMVWCPMNKGVINLYRYREVSLAANERYLEALVGGRGSGPGLSSGRGTDRAGGGLRPKSCGFQPGQWGRREAVQCGAGWQPPGTWIPQRRHPGSAV